MVSPEALLSAHARSYARKMDDWGPMEGSMEGKRTGLRFERPVPIRGGRIHRTNRLKACGNGFDARITSAAWRKIDRELPRMRYAYTTPPERQTDFRRTFKSL